MVVVIEKRNDEWKIVGFIGDINEAGTMYVVRPVVYEDGIIEIYGVGRWFETYEGNEELFEKLVSNLDGLKELFNSVGLNVRDVRVNKENKTIVVEFDISDVCVKDEDESVDEAIKRHIGSRIEEVLFGALVTL